MNSRYSNSLRSSSILDSLSYHELLERLSLKRKEVEIDYIGDGKGLRVVRTIAPWNDVHCFWV